MTQDSRLDRRTLDSVATLGDSTDISYAFREWLDAFYRGDESERVRLLSVEPSKTPFPFWNAMFAASAEHLARLANIRPPEWCHESWRNLKDPYFAAKSDKMRVVLLVQSPAAFRIRNLFISVDGIERATTPPEWRADKDFGIKRVDRIDTNEDENEPFFG